MKTNLFFTIIVSIVLVPGVFSQRPRAGGPPPPPRAEGPRDQGWGQSVDLNRNGIIESNEFQAALDRTFAHFDKNGNGIIEQDERPGPSKDERRGPPMGQPGGQPGMAIAPRGDGPPPARGGDRGEPSTRPSG